MGNKASKQVNKEAAQDWIKLKKQPLVRTTNVVVVDENTFLIVTETDKKKNKNNQYWIYKYVVNKNKWIKLMRIHRKINTHWSSLAFHKNTNTLYICNGGSKSILEVCLTDNNYKWKHYSTVTRSKQDGFGGSRSIFINDALHIIGGDYSYKHLKFHTKTKKVEEVTKINAASKYGLIYDKNQETLLLFGGERRKYKSDGKSFSSHTSMSIMKYTFNSNDDMWINLTNKEKLIMPKPMCRFGYVLSNDNKYALFFGGNSGILKSLDDIYIFDIENKTFLQSTIKCPIESSYNAVLVQYHATTLLLIYGYLRNINRNMTSNDVINLIHSMCNMEYIHLFCCNGHWKISLDDVLKDAFPAKMPQIQVEANK